MTERPEAYSVGAITRMIKDNLEGAFHSLWVEGEISNYTHHSSGHRYLSLKDDRAVLKVVMWRSVGAHLKFEPEAGQKVLAYGDISVYEKGGAYQLSCRKLVPVGVGELELAFRQLYEKLSAEGLFDEGRKRPLPDYPKRIGLVTSPTGAAVRDIIQISRRRNNTVQLFIYPSKVQGAGAEDTIKTGIEYFNSRDDIDLLIVGRGGGSLEDLWPFNMETTVRAIVASRVPVISAVGHEIDTTLSDLAADLRAPTPSAAAELAVWSLGDFKETVGYNTRRQAELLGDLIDTYRDRLSSLIGRPVLARPLEMVRQRQQYLDSTTRLLTAAGKNRFEKDRNRLSLAASRLEALSPLRILARGYSVSRRLPGKKVLWSVDDIYPSDRMETVLSDGKVVSYVEEILKDPQKKKKRRASKKTT